MPGRCLEVRGTKGKFLFLSCSSEQGLQQEGLDLVKQEGGFKVHSFHSLTLPEFPSHCIDPLSLDSSGLLTGASAGGMNRGRGSQQPPCHWRKVLAGLVLFNNPPARVPDMESKAVLLIYIQIAIWASQQCTGEPPPAVLLLKVARMLTLV